MSSLACWFRCLVGRQVCSKTSSMFLRNSCVRSYADKPEVHSKQMKGTEIEEKVRVRRARPADVPRVLRFVREHARSAWPGLASPPSSPQLMLCDYVARALAQGHSMLAEQREGRCDWSQIRGMALAAVVSPWDATLLEKWSRCVFCPRTKRLMAFTAHCLRGPQLHSKYNVHNILQVLLMVPQNENPRSAEIIKMLTKNSIKRGQECGFSLIRFDVTSDQAEKHMEELKLKKEWQLFYDILTEPYKDVNMHRKIEAIKETESKKNTDSLNDNTPDAKKGEKYKANDEDPFKHRIVVYTALTTSVQKT